MQRQNQEIFLPYQRLSHQSSWLNFTQSLSLRNSGKLDLCFLRPTLYNLSRQYNHLVNASLRHILTSLRNFLTRVTLFIKRTRDYFYPIIFPISYYMCPDFTGHIRVLEFFMYDADIGNVVSVHELETMVSPVAEERYPRYKARVYATYRSISRPEYGASFGVEFSKQWSAEISASHADSLTGTLAVTYSF
jgi:hypothetical protein